MGAQDLHAIVLMLMAPIGIFLGFSITNAVVEKRAGTAVSAMLSMCCLFAISFVVDALARLP